MHSYANVDQTLIVANSNKFLMNHQHMVRYQIKA